MPLCSVYGCANSRGRDKDIGYYYFPNKHKYPSLHNKWILCTKRNNFIPTTKSVICGIHFRKEDFNQSDVLKLRLLPDSKLKQPRLNDGAIPTKFPKCKIPKRSKKKGSSLRMKMESEVLGSNKPSTSSTAESEALHVNKAASDQLTCDKGVQCELGVETYRNAMNKPERCSTRTNSDSDCDEKKISDCWDSDTKPSRHAQLIASEQNTSVGLMDVIKTEPEDDLLAAQSCDYTDAKVENLSPYESALQSLDGNCDIKSEIKIEDTSETVVKCEPEEEACGMVIVKEEGTAEESEIVCDSKLI